MYPKLIRFVGPVLAYCESCRHAAGKLNFQDLRMEAAKLVRENGEVKGVFR